MDLIFVNWCALPPEAQAAWAQALLSFLAMLVAIAVPTYLHLAERRQRAVVRTAKTKSIALAVINELIPLEQKLTEYMNQWSDNLRDHLDSDEFQELTTVPPTLSVVTRDLHDLDKAAESVSELIIALTFASKQWKDWNVLRYGRGTDVAPVEEAILQNLKHAKECANKANRELLKLFNVRLNGDVHLGREFDLGRGEISNTTG